jgi:hypothetical protein
MAQEFGISNACTDANDLITHPEVSNPLSFGKAEDNKVEGANGDNQPPDVLRIPERYQDLPASKLDASVLDLAYLYAAYANDRETGSLTASTFADALTMHKLIDLISEAASSGRQKELAISSLYFTDN